MDGTRTGDGAGRVFLQVSVNRGHAKLRTLPLKSCQAALTGKAQLQQRWLGRPIWKNPMDCWVYQEILYDTQPELVLELGIAHGGNLLFMADIFRCMNRARTQIVGIDMDISRARDLK